MPRFTEVNHTYVDKCPSTIQMIIYSDFQIADFNVFVKFAS